MCDMPVWIPIKWASEAAGLSTQVSYKMYRYMANSGKYCLSIQFISFSLAVDVSK